MVTAYEEYLSYDIQKTLWHRLNKFPINNPLLKRYGIVGTLCNN